MACIPEIRPDVVPRRCRPAIIVVAILTALPVWRSLEFKQTKRCKIRKEEDSKFEGSPWRLITEDRQHFRLDLID